MSGVSRMFQAVWLSDLKKANIERIQLLHPHQPRPTGAQESRGQKSDSLAINWKIAQKICDASGIEFHAILQPSAYNGKSVFDKRYKIVRGDCMHDVYDDICELVRVELNNSPWFHDFTNVLDGQGPFFIDGCHISDQGNAIVANNIGHFIKSNRENQVINR